jgi:outer membrane protein OmpA-like peptidoglycan-associated protein
MAEDWSIDVRKYVPDADEGVIAAIVRHLGIALRSRDASLVSFTDPKELETVRESWLKKKLGLTDPDEVLDAAIARVGERMKADTTKNRVTVYYLLAEMFGKLGLFGAAATATAAVAEDKPEPVAAAAPLAAAAIPVAATVAAPARAKPAEPERRADAGIIRTGIIALGVLGAVVLGAAIIGELIANPSTNSTPKDRFVVTKPAEVAAPAAPAIPTGSGVMAEMVDGKPALNVYFATAERTAAPLGTEAAALKAYVDSHPEDRLSVSGYVDPRGDAAFNAELAKDRAVNTKAALVAAGIPEDKIDLDKPADIVGGDASLAEDRRVTVRIKVLGVVTAPAVVEKTQAMP